MDAAHQDAQFGVGPSQIYRKRAWSITDSSYQDLGRLGSYGRVMLRGMGDTTQDLNALAQVAATVPSDIMAAEGTYPYSSFLTPYSPGAGLSPAGYTATASVPTATASLSSSPGMLVVIGILGVAAVMMFSRKR
jgi:hypothetical protein